MYSIVLLDDEYCILNGLKELLEWETYGFRIAQAFTQPHAAIEYIIQHPVDVLISDIRMPEYSGIDVLRKLRKHNIHKTQVLLLSGYAEFEYAQEAITLGVREYFLKPVDRQLLIDTLQTIKAELDGKQVLLDEHEPHSEGYYRAIAETIKQYLEKEFASATLDRAAELVAMSPNYVSKVFKEVTGTLFSDYLMHLKMLNAKILLADINLRIYEVSYAVGYDNPKNFTRAFKQFYGMTPWEYRKAGSS